MRPRAKVTIDSLYEVVYEKSIGTKMNDLDLCLEVVSRSCQPLRHILLLLLLLVWQAPLGVRSAKRRHQSPEWTIISHSYRLIQGEIV